MEICLFEPEIAQNAGTISRLCACFGVSLNIIEPASFVIDDKHFKRAGMDYIDKTSIKFHESFNAFKETHGKSRIILFDTKGSDIYYNIKYEETDCLLFGRESSGVPSEVYELCDKKALIPMVQGVRSINLAMSVAIGLSESMKQICCCQTQNNHHMG